MKIAVMTREPQDGKNDRLTVAQDGEWRAVVWGRKSGEHSGAKLEKVANTFEKYVENREVRGYVKQMEVTINADADTILAYLIKILA